MGKALPCKHEDLSMHLKNHVGDESVVGGSVVPVDRHSMACAHLCSTHEHTAVAWLGCGFYMSRFVPSAGLRSASSEFNTIVDFLHCRVLSVKYCLFSIDLVLGMAARGGLVSIAPVHGMPSYKRDVGA